MLGLLKLTIDPLGHELLHQQLVSLIVYLYVLFSVIKYNFALRHKFPCMSYPAFCKEYELKYLQSEFNMSILNPNSNLRCSRLEVIKCPVIFFFHLWSDSELQIMPQTVLCDTCVEFLKFHENCKILPHNGIQKLYVLLLSSFALPIVSSL